MSSTSRHSRFHARYLVLVIALFTLTGIVLLLIDLWFDPSSVLQPVLSDLGISLVAFGLTSIVFTVLTNKIFEDMVADRLSTETANFLGDLRENVHVDIGKVTERLEGFVPLFSNCDALGLVNVYLTRTDALQDFSVALDTVLEMAGHTTHRPGPGGTPHQMRLWFVSSSMNGFLKFSTKNFDGSRFIERAAQLAAAGRVDLRILMTSPDRADERAVQEDREVGDIPREITMNATFLHRIGVQHDVVRFIRSTPTVFAIATDDLMLLNPYPHGQEAFRSFCLTVRRTPNATAQDIYRQYEQSHFLEPWGNAELVPEDLWSARSSRVAAASAAPPAQRPGHDGEMRGSPPGQGYRVSHGGPNDHTR